MISVMVRLLEIYLGIALCDFQKFPVEIFPEFVGNDRMSVFGRQDKVVVRQVDAVFVPSVFLWLVHSVILA